MLYIHFIAQLVQRLAKGWMLRESNSYGAMFSAPGAHQASCTKGIGFLSMGKAFGSWL